METDVRRMMAFIVSHDFKVTLMAISSSSSLRSKDRLDLVTAVVLTMTEPSSLYFINHTTSPELRGFFSHIQFSHSAQWIHTLT